MLAITWSGEAVLGMYSIPWGMGSVAVTLVAGFVSVFLYVATYSMTSPGLALSAEVLCSVPSAFTILWALRTTFTSLHTGKKHKVKMLRTASFDFINFCMWQDFSSFLLFAGGRLGLGNRSVTNGQ